MSCCSTKLSSAPPELHQSCWKPNTRTLRTLTHCLLGSFRHNFLPLQSGTATDATLKYMRKYLSGGLEPNNLGAPR